MSWEEFINRNPMFVRHVSVLYAIYVRMEGFNFSTQISNYQPAALLEDKTSQCWNLLEEQAFFLPMIYSDAYHVERFYASWQCFA